jgi:hypothetical protein
MKEGDGQLEVKEIKEEGVRAKAARVVQDEITWVVSGLDA